MNNLFLLSVLALGLASAHQHLQSPRPRYYSDLPAHILASPRPRPHGPPQGHPAQYRTLNPLPHPRNPRSEPPQQQQQAPQPPKPTPQLLASASTTPVLVLKKDHSRPILSSAVVAAALAEKRAQQAQTQHDQKPIPTVILPPMERPSPPQPQQQQQSEKKGQSEEEEERPQEPLKSEKVSRHDTSLEHDDLSDEQPSRIPPTASAERRMFFNSVQQSNAMAHQVSGPQGPSNPRPRKQQPHPSASSLPQHRPAPHHHQQQQHRHVFEEDEPVERITRQSQQNSYPGFEYPPPQGNYVSQGPTRVPVKYQQGIQGGRPQQHHPNHHQGKPRPYKQRVQQQPGSEEALTTEEELEDEEEQKPDRLQTLLQDSKFACGGKDNGYYADDSLNCEVFHYCQDGGKHSWLCPEGFAFHQIHLICSPQDKTMCSQSSQIAKTVNSHLYKPINEEEAKLYNTSLRYSDRYYPEDYVHGGGDVSLPYQDDDEDVEIRPQVHKQAPPHNPYAHIQAQPRPRPTQQSPPYNPYANIQASPRPQPHNPYSQGGFVPSPQLPAPARLTPQQAQRLQQAYAQQRSGQAIAPQQKPVHHHKSHHAHPPSKSSGGHPGVFFSPESINIPLQNRRPTPHHPAHVAIFKPSPQVHKQAAAPSTKDDEYEY